MNKAEIKLPVRYDNAGLFVDADGQTILVIYGWSKNKPSKNLALGEFIVEAINNHNRLADEVKAYLAEIGRRGGQKPSPLKKYESNAERQKAWRKRQKDKKTSATK